MLQALRFVIQGAGAKVDAAIRKSLVSLLLSMLGHDEVWRGSGLLQSPLLFVFACFLHVVWGQPCPYDALPLRESGSVIGADFGGSGVVVLTMLGSKKARSHGHCACVPVSPLHSSPVLWVKQLGHQAFPSRFSVSRSPCLSPDGARLQSRAEPFSSVVAAVEGEVAHRCAFTKSQRPGTPGCTRSH